MGVRRKFICWQLTQHVLQRDVIELRQVLRLQLLRLRQLVAHGCRGSGADSEARLSGSRCPLHHRCF